MGPVAVWILAIAMGLSALYRYRVSVLPVRNTAISILISGIAGLLFGIIKVSVIGVVGDTAICIFVFGMASHTFIKYRTGLDRNNERIRRMFDEHPEMHEKFQSHWFFGRQGRHIDEKEQTRRDP